MADIEREGQTAIAAERPGSPVSPISDAPAVRPVQRHLLTVAVAAGVLALALDGATYAFTSRHSVAIGVWWTLTLAVALRIWPLARPPRAALVTGGLLCALALLTGLSTLWAESEEKTFAEFNRVLLYLGAFSLAVMAGTPRNAPRWRDGIALGLTAVGLVALGSRLFDLPGNRDLFRYLPGVSEPLSYPVNYRNGLAILLGLGFPLLLGAATSRLRSLAGGLAVAALPALVAVIYLASSRGGAMIAIVGAGLFLTLTSRRASALGAIVCAGAGGAVVIAVLDARPDLVDGPLGTTAASSQGASAALLIALVCIATGLLYGAGSRFTALPSQALGAGPKRALAIVGAVAVIAAVVVADPKQRFETFKRPPDPEAIPGGSGYTAAHLQSGSGSGRWQFWESAVEQFETRPVLGRGAGSYEAWWTEHGNLPYFIRDAHSLYIETLGELGVIGLCLVLALFGCGLAAAMVRVRRAPPRDRPIPAALTASFAGFIFAAGFDWMWELTAVGMVGMVCLGLLVGPATAGGPEPAVTGSDNTDVAPPRPAIRRAFVLAGLLIVVTQAVPLLARTEIQGSREAVARGDGEAALEHALNARALQGWAVSPHLQLALVEEQTGDLAAARSAIADAIERDRSDWRLWLVSARLETKTGRIDAAERRLREARRLNPRSLVLAAP